MKIDQLCGRMMTRCGGRCNGSCFDDVLVVRDMGRLHLFRHKLTFVVVRTIRYDKGYKHKTQRTTSNVIRNDKKIANLDSDVF